MVAKRLPLLSMALLCLVAGAVPQEQPVPAAAQPASKTRAKATATLAGVVVNAVTAAPVRKSTVRLSPEGGGMGAEAQTATSDGEGRRSHEAV